MHVLRVRNVHQALYDGIRLLDRTGEWRQSRNGGVLVCPEPVTTVYSRPLERVIFWPKRDANPFFHLIEAMWMLAGRNDVDILAGYVSRMREFSDDGRTLHGAYGHRWRVHFGFDQLAVIARRLRDDPLDRRCVLGMWDTRVDLDRHGKDLPCNTQIYFRRDGDDGDLDMTVTCRSNDAVWGAYGANAVHFSFLQEAMANWIGCGVGRYWQISNNFHVYESVLSQIPLGTLNVTPDPYEDGLVEPMPMDIKMDGLTVQEIDRTLERPSPLTMGSKFLSGCVAPMIMAHRAYKNHRHDLALEILEQCEAPDWRMAAEEWIRRRMEGLEKKFQETRGA